MKHIYVLNEIRFAYTRVKLSVTDHVSMKNVFICGIAQQLHICDGI